MNAASESDGHLVFVYGSLKRGFYNHHRLRRHTYVADVVTEPCFALHGLGRYPGMIRTSHQPHEVHGELWQVDHRGLIDLDRLEGNGRLYQRELIPVFNEHHRWQAWVYLYLGDVSGREEVGTGWKKGKEPKHDNTKHPEGQKVSGPTRSRGDAERKRKHSKDF